MGQPHKTNPNARRHGQNKRKDKKDVRIGTKHERIIRKLVQVCDLPRAEDPVSDHHRFHASDHRDS